MEVVDPEGDGEEGWHEASTQEWITEFEVPGIWQAIGEGSCFGDGLGRVNTCHSVAKGPQRIEDEPYIVPQISKKSTRQAAFRSEGLQYIVGISDTIANQEGEQGQKEPRSLGFVDILC